MLVVRANTRDLINIAKEHNAGVASEQEFMDMYSYCKSKGNYNFLTIDYNKPQDEIFSMNLGTEILNPKKLL